MVNSDSLVLVLNAGSSSLKFGIYADASCDESAPRLYHGEFCQFDAHPHFNLIQDGGETLLNEPADCRNHEQAVHQLLNWMERELGDRPLHAAGHRVVHGGREFTSPLLIDRKNLQVLRSLVPLAPLHIPHNLAAIEALLTSHPALPQVACFDTAFHHDMAWPEQAYAIPREWFAAGVRRYGFHGLSYEYIASTLPDFLGAAAGGRIIVAHLGHGASLCAMHNRRSVATSMGFTPLDGIPMATRPGQIDPGVITWMLREAGLSVAEVDHLLNYHSGLLGLSGISADMQQLLSDDHPAAVRAVEYFIHHTHRQIASLAATLQGLDALVFTAGIGENSAEIRQRLCHHARWLGIELDAGANARNSARISKPDSPVSVWCIPTDEARMIVRHTLNVVSKD